jgi:hypothetical protein
MAIIITKSDWDKFNYISSGQDENIWPDAWISVQDIARWLYRGTDLIPRLLICLCLARPDQMNPGANPGLGGSSRGALVEAAEGGVHPARWQ